MKHEEFSREPNIELQEKIMERSGIQHGDADAQAEWVITHAVHYREIIEANPELLARYQSDPDTVIQEVRELLENMKEETVH